MYKELQGLQISAQTARSFQDSPETEDIHTGKENHLEMQSVEAILVDWVSRESYMKVEGFILGFEEHRKF